MVSNPLSAAEDPKEHHRAGHHQPDHSPEAPALGLPWQDVFQTADKAEVEAYCRDNRIQFEWKGDERYFEIEVESGAKAKYFYQDTESHLEREGDFQAEGAMESVLEYLLKVAAG